MEPWRACNKGRLRVVLGHERIMFIHYAVLQMFLWDIYVQAFDNDFVMSINSNSLSITIQVGSKLFSKDKECLRKKKKKKLV